jgi:hypothetical protein
LALDRDVGSAFVEAYRRTWETWDMDGFVGLFDDDVFYCAHPDEMVVGGDALRRYLEQEKTAQGAVDVRMGDPLIEGDRVMAEFWVTATNPGAEASIAGCFIARLDGSEGRCSLFREYWFDLEGHRNAYEGWGE